MNGQSTGIAGVKRFNRLLDSEAATLYETATNKLSALSPFKMERLSQTETVIQAFAFDTVVKFAARHPAPLILCLDNEESPACASLRELGYPVEQLEWDPQSQRPTSLNATGPSAPVHQIVFRSTPLANSDQDKALFARATATLASGGIGVFIMSIEPGREPTAARPKKTARPADFKALSENLLSSGEGCSLVDEPDWRSRSSPGDGPLAGAVASLVVQKFPERANGELMPELLRERKLVVDRVILLSGELSKLRKEKVDAVWLSNDRQRQLNEMSVELTQQRKEREDAVRMSNDRQRRLDEINVELTELRKERDEAIRLSNDRQRQLDESSAEMDDAIRMSNDRQRQLDETSVELTQLRKERDEAIRVSNDRQRQFEKSSVELIQLRKERDEEIWRSNDRQRELDETSVELTELQGEKDAAVWLLNDRQRHLDANFVELTQLRKEKDSAVWLSHDRQRRLNEMLVELTQLRNERDEAIRLSKDRQNQLNQVLESRTFRLAQRLKPWLRPFVAVVRRLPR